MAGKKKVKKARSITIKLTFTEDDLQSMLDAAAFGGDGLQVSELSAKRFKELKEYLQDDAPQFVFEIVDGSPDACANDWLYEFRPEADE